MMTVIALTPDADDQYFRDGVAQGSCSCSDVSAAGRSGSRPFDVSELLFVRAGHTGSIGPGAYLQLDRFASPDGGRSTPPNRRRLDLEEGVKLVSNLVDLELEDVRHGLEVECVFHELDGVELPQFRPSE